MSNRSADNILSPDQLAGALQPLENATTLPSGAFTSSDVYASETERIFEREWLCAGRADQISEPGDYFTLDLLDEKLVIVRGSDNEIRVLSRVCRHRAADVVQGAGNTRSFQCPYHSWTYRLDGQLLGAPFMEGAEGFDKESCRLPALRSELWEGWIFVNFDAEAAPLGPQLEPLSKRLANYGMSEMVAVHTATFESPFNWKVLVDNFMEAYHHIAIHGDTLEPSFPARLSSTSDVEGPFSVLRMPGGSKDHESPLRSLPRVGVLDPDQEAQLVAAVVYPFHLFAPSAESLTWYQLLPQGHDHFTLHIFSCFPRKTLDDPARQEMVDGLKAFVKVIHHQDIEACEAVWAGLQSRSFESGPLSPLEKSIWQFNQWWIERMVGTREGSRG